MPPARSRRMIRGSSQTETPSSWSTSHRRSENPRPNRSPRSSASDPAHSRNGLPRPNIVSVQDANEDFMEQIIVAVDMRDTGTVGCAYYIASEERLLCMEEINGGGVDVVEKLKIDLQPTTLLLSTRSDSALNQINGHPRQRHSSLVKNDDGHNPLPYDLEIRPSAEFEFNSALNRLLALQFTLDPGKNVQFLVPGPPASYDQDLLPEDLGLSTRKGRFLQLSSYLNLDNRISLGCAGAIAGHLQRKRASEFLPDDPNANLVWRVTALDMFSLKDTMMINADSLASLQILQGESHPKTFNQGPGTSGTKESLSLFGLFQNHARTSQGKAALRRSFLRPTLNVDEIQGRLDFISVFVRPDNQTNCQKLSKSLSKVKNMRTTIVLLHKGIDGGRQKQSTFKGGVWSSLIEFCYHAIDVVETLGEVLGASQLPICARVFDTLDRFHMQRIGHIIFETVDLESSADQHRTVVKRGVNDQLDEVKNVYDGMDDMLSRKAIEIASLLPLGVNIALNVIYFPHLGFHLTVPLDKITGQAVYDGADLGWECMFTTTNQVYFKDSNTHEMDHDLGDLYAVICDYEIEIAHDLAQDILAHEKLLITVSDLCGELDCLLALAHAARQYKLTRPQITEENIIEIKGGRHLLHEMSVPAFVTNDTLLVGGGCGEDDAGSSAASSKTGPSMILLTGPNYSGKSVYQKQVALVVYMAHVGSYVPAACATIGITDKILTRIASRETVSKVQSAFMIDIQQTAIALSSCTRRSLVVIDEFGKGTDTCDGAGLAAGLFCHLLSLGPDAPKTVAATHFHEIFDLGLFDRFANVAFAHMEVRVSKQGDGYTAGKHDVEVAYLYNLHAGKSDLSYGAQCAALNGVPVEVVERAAQLARMSGRGEDLVTTCSTLSERDGEELWDAESAARKFLSMRFDEKMVEVELMGALDSMLGPVDEEPDELSVLAS
ncbi:uncharacterized protein A1O9_12329 [Exophiala aquamarina CBS 119918]|uniref:DNA mismatch repair protein MSH5 n=1 Tax=Exophiala aquamarina CBS 119918 TaxID=1182545 RepID=A0A072NUY7_9EURO|nr:uncharacterized protein A1O9_12329 [Exophiala aquamarina CBS 119918]KEF51694.1 hypothetical protein A1O9_12329 [Exophiala aquamarina CBS 119918]